MSDCCRCRADLWREHSRLHPGLQVGSSVGYGTLGPVCLMGGQPYFLTALHTFQPPGQAGEPCSASQPALKAVFGSVAHAYASLDVCLVALNYTRVLAGSLRSALPAAPAVGQQVYKIGAKTGLTSGVVHAEAAGQMMIRAAGVPVFGLPGDSGAAVVSTAGHLLGVLVGRSEEGFVAVSIESVALHLPAPATWFL